jgi:hypothetical protein
MSNATKSNDLNSLPLWRLLVALDDAERKLGSESETARALAAEISQRLKTEQKQTRGVKAVQDAR